MCSTVAILTNLQAMETDDAFIDKEIARELNTLELSEHNDEQAELAVEITTRELTFLPDSDVILTQLEQKFISQRLAFERQLEECKSLLATSDEKLASKPSAPDLTELALEYGKDEAALQKIYEELIADDDEDKGSSSASDDVEHSDLGASSSELSVRSFAEDSSSTSYKALEKLAKQEMNKWKRKNALMSQRTEGVQDELRTHRLAVEQKASEEREKRLLSVQHEKQQAQAFLQQRDKELSRMLAEEKEKFNLSLQEFESQIHQIERQTQQQHNQLELERKILLEEEKTRKARAATKIQACYRGYRVRMVYAPELSRKVDISLHKLRAAKVEQAEARIQKRNEEIAAVQRAEKFKIEEEARKLELEKKAFAEQQRIREMEETKKAEQKAAVEAERQRKNEEKRLLAEKQKAERAEQKRKELEAEMARKTQALKEEEFRRLEEKRIDEERKCLEAQELEKKRKEDEEHEKQLEEDAKKAREAEQQKTEEEFKRMKEAETREKERQLAEAILQQENERKKKEEECKAVEEESKRRLELDRIMAAEASKQQEYQLWMKEHSQQKVHDVLPEKQPETSSLSLMDMQHIYAKMEERRRRWMQECNPWSKIFTASKNKLVTPSKVIRRPSSASKNLELVPLSEQLILSQNHLKSLAQVEAVQFRDLPGCSLSTLVACTRLRAVSIVRCGVVSFESVVRQLQYVHLKENILDSVSIQSAALVYLNLSKNRLQAIKGFESCVNLAYLNLSENKITRITGLGFFKRLHSVDLSYNELISSRGMGECPTVQHLNLSHNHLTALDDLDNLCLLQHLHAYSNNIMEIPKLVNHVLLSHLDLHDNSVSTLDGLAYLWLPMLLQMNLSSNSISLLQPLHGCFMIEDLDLAHNQLIDSRNVTDGLKFCCRLQKLTIAGNPCAKDKSHVQFLSTNLPYVKCVDGVDTAVTGTLPSNDFGQMCAEAHRLFDGLLAEHNAVLGENLFTKDCSNDELLSSLAVLVSYYERSFGLAENLRYAHEYGDLIISEPPRQTLNAAKNSFELKLAAVHKPNATSQSTNASSQPVSDSPQGHATPDNGAYNGANSEPNARDLFEQRLRDKLESTPLRVSKENLKILKTTYNTSPRLSQRSQSPRSSQCDQLPHAANHQGSLTVPEKDSLYRSKTEDPLLDLVVKVNQPIRNPVDVRLLHSAATKIQALWRGYTLRQRLLDAVNYAREHSYGSDEELPEVDLSKFDLDLDDGWLPSEVPQLPQRHAVLPSKVPSANHPSVDHDLYPHPPMASRQAWHHSGLTPPGSAMSGDVTQRSSRSKKEEQLAQEWGFKDSQTAELMLKRAKKLKYNAERRKKISSLDPKERYELQKKIHMTMEPPKVVVSNRKPAKPKKEYFQALEEEANRKLREKRLQDDGKADRTYEWLHSQYTGWTDTSAPQHAEILPYLDKRVIEGGRTQLVGSPLEMQSVDSYDRSSAGARRPTQQPNKVTHIDHDHESVESSSKSFSASSRSKEKKASHDLSRQELNDLTWGSGKKRAKR